MLSIAQSRAATPARRVAGLRRFVRVPTEAEVVREIGTVLAVMLALVFAVNWALIAFGVE